MSPPEERVRPRRRRLLDEQLGPADLPRISAYVAACPACQKALESLTAGPGPEFPSWRGLAPDDSRPHLDFLDRMKEAPPGRTAG